MTNNLITIHFDEQSYQVWQDAPYSPAISHGYTATDENDLKRIRDTSMHYQQIRTRADWRKNYSQG